ncbi:cell division protein ZapB [Kangiella sediminilitoris]|uniref:TIGR02449 family protein n=1 Tax=Kangiella sediminilitoris TaxID=1144748 RepID=A0A1B3B7W1_9GAMM|nr:cell division protein ZapB [Kangiella sediminilitoris]AOE48880.1 TIGR02449 family protein [Kangiella sediminilitoris]
MTNSQFEQLEEKIDALLARFNVIDNENQQLRQQVNELRVERDRLQSRNESARKQIDLMISRLKSL